MIYILIYLFIAASTVVRQNHEDRGNCWKLNSQWEVDHGRIQAKQCPICNLTVSGQKEIKDHITQYHKGVAKVCILN